MSAFKVKLGIGLAILFTAFFASQLAYRQNIAHLHDYILQSLALSEEMHNAEIFHSSMHSMILTAQSDMEKKDRSFSKQYLLHKKNAEDALLKLKRQSHEVGASGMPTGAAPAAHSTGEVLDHITEGFSSFQAVLDRIYLTPEDSPGQRLAEAKGIFDKVFHHYYLKLHEHHAMRIDEMRKAAHRVKVSTDIYFIAQLAFALLAGAAVLFYIDRVVLKIYSITEHYSQTDALTSLYNRRYLEKYLTDEIRRASRYNRQISIAMIDIDDFKKFNDTFGHPAGDKLLRDIALLLKTHTRGTDKIFRYGGEEFLIVQPETDKASSLTVAEKIRKLIEAHTFMFPHRQPSSVTLSIGIAAFPDDGKTIEDIIKIADDMLYKAKSGGKNRVKANSEVSQQSSMP